MNDEQPPPALADGIYFGLHEDDYHALPRLSASGIQNMMVSPADFWAKSWLNTDKKEKPDTNAQVLGRAYHTARFEPDRFHQIYCRALDKVDMPPGALMTDADISAALEDLGLPKTAKGEKVLDKAMRLIDAGYTGTVWHYELAMFEAQTEGKIPITGKYYDDLIADVESLHQNPEVAEHLTGGQAEVSILWTDATTGVPMKCRIDYLRPLSFTDFKTFDNSRGQHVQQAIMSAITYNRYYIQAFNYWEAVELIRGGTLEVMGDASEEQRDLITSIRLNRAPMEAWYVFQQKGGVPNVFAVYFPAYASHPSVDMNGAGLTDEDLAQAKLEMGGATFIRTKAIQEIRNARNLFLRYSEIYADGGRWYPVKPIMDAGDEAYNSYWLEAIWNG